MAAAHALTALAPQLSPLVVGVLIGVVLANIGMVPVAVMPGASFAATSILKLGIVFLGFELALPQLLDLGGTALLVVVGVVTLTFFGILWLGKQFGLSSSLSLLIGTGYSICGASAIAAVEGVSDGEEEEVAFSIALVTLFGSLAIFVLPLVSGALGLEGSSFGAWAGASVHDVAQVVATAATGGSAALHTAIVVKLTRVVLLAPLVAGVSIVRRRRATADTSAVDLPPLIPIFVAGFLAASMIRSAGLVPSELLEIFGAAADLALGAALVALGMRVNLRELRRIGVRPLLLGLVGWVLVAGIAYLGVLLVNF